MNGEKTHYHEPSADERTARRVLSLAIALTNARRPRTTSELRRDLYSDLGDEAFKKAFARDRERLEVAGIFCREGDRVDREKTWTIDEERSFTIEGALTPDDALALDFLLLPIASDPAFPYARDLRMALAKIDRSFDGTSTARIPPEARKRNNFLTRIEDCLSSKTCFRMTYERADGSRIDRVLAPYGLFYLHGTTYLVASRVEGSTPVESAHTYNLDRVHAMRELPRIRYEIPSDFDVRDFIKLPFQIGDTLYTAQFEDDGGSVTSYEVSDEGIAAAWAIAKGLRPLSPESLVATWRSRLERVARGAVS